MILVEYFLLVWILSKGKMKLQTNLHTKYMDTLQRVSQTHLHMPCDLATQITSDVDTLYFYRLTWAQEMGKEMGRVWVLLPVPLYTSLDHQLVCLLLAITAGCLWCSLFLCIPLSTLWLHHGIALLLTCPWSTWWLFDCCISLAVVVPQHVLSRWLWHLLFVCVCVWFLYTG